MHDTKLNFEGIDSEEKQQLALNNLLKIENELREIYIERVKMFNNESYKHNPEPFRFLDKSNCSVVIFILPYEFDYSISVQFYFLSTPGDRKEEVHVLSFKDLSDLDSYPATYSFFQEKIIPSFGFDKSQIITDSVDFYNNLSNPNNIFDIKTIEHFVQFSTLKDSILSSIRYDVRDFQIVNNTKLSYFAKDVHKFPFSIVDLIPLVDLVNDKDFTYQLDQSMAAYHENLFLPCAATLGVVLETLCIKILEDNGIKKIKSGDTQLGKLKERLINERIITRRDNTRLEVAYKMRNMASHSSPGIALKEDCHFMLNVINTIAFEYLTEN